MAEPRKATFYRNAIFFKKTKYCKLEKNKRADSTDSVRSRFRRMRVL
jgi:hypothetical protein